MPSITWHKGANSGNNILNSPHITCVTQTSTNQILFGFAKSKNL